MKLKEKTSIFNMGDTSIRVKEIIPIYKQILKTLENHNKVHHVWDKKNQEIFYKSILNDFSEVEKNEDRRLFNNFNRNETNELDKRGRTLTNSISKLGFVDNTRKLTEVGKDYIEDNIIFDNLEKLLGLTTDNIIYLRQLLKLRIYASNTDNYFYNFRFSLIFLNKYSNVPERDFLWIVESIKPTFSLEKIQSIIKNYENVYKNNKTFDEYKAEEFAEEILIAERVEKAKNMFELNDFSDSNFIELFPNRKNSEKSLEYKKFVVSVIEFLNNSTDFTLKNMIEISKKSEIKKAFGKGKTIFNYKNKDSVATFFDKNIDNPLLSSNHFNIYLEFALSKHNDLIKEYSDMCKRIFSLSGIINFNKGVVSLGQPWIVKKLISLKSEINNIVGDSPYESYERDIDSLFFKNISVVNILNIGNRTIEKLSKEIAEEFRITDVSKISQFIEDKQEKEFVEFINKEFTVPKTIEILEAISERNDLKVQEMVTDNALVPTIFEYILGVAWYHISNKQFSLRKSMQLTFSADHLPLSHAGGNKGDIEIEYTDKMLLLEATLMDKSTQKRGELEPVIRHSINLALNVQPKKLQTIFVANEIDTNVSNIFRASSFIELNGTLSKGSIKGINIFSITIPEIINILNNGIKEDKIFSVLEKYNTSQPQFIKNGWREDIINEILLTK